MGTVRTCPDESSYLTRNTVDECVGTENLNLAANVRFGSKADICVAKSDVRFTPNSDRESEFPHKAMSALPLKADMCSALADVCYGPKADMRRTCHSYSMTSSARPSTTGGIARPSALAVLRLITSSYLVGACTGRSAGFSPLRMRST